MNKGMSFAVFVTLILLTPASIAFPVTGNQIQTDNGEISAGVTPDSFLYFLDVALDNIDLAFSFDPKGKAEKGLRIARERLLEVKAMVEANNLPAAQIAGQEHENVLSSVEDSVDALDATDPEDEVEDEIEIEKDIQEHKDEIDNVQGELNIKIRTKGDVTPSQQALIDSVINSLGDNVRKLEIKVDNKIGETKIEIKLVTGKSDEEVDDDVKNLKIKLLSKVKVRAEIFGEQAEVKIKNKFTTEETDRASIINEIIERFALDSETADSLLKIEDHEDHEHDEADEHDIDEQGEEENEEVDEEENEPEEAEENNVDDDEETDTDEPEEEEENEQTTASASAGIILLQGTDNDEEDEPDEPDVDEKDEDEPEEAEAEEEDEPDVDEQDKEESNELEVNENEEEEKNEEEGPEEKFRVRVKVREGRETEVEVELKFILNSTDRGDIVAAVVENSQLTSEQIENVLEFRVREENDELEIEIDKDEEGTNIEIDFGDDDLEFLTDEIDIDKIIAEISERTGISEEDIKNALKVDEGKDLEKQLENLLEEDDAMEEETNDEDKDDESMEEETNDEDKDDESMEEETKDEDDDAMEDNSVKDEDDVKDEENGNQADIEEDKTLDDNQLDNSGSNSGSG